MTGPTTHRPHPHVGGRAAALRALAAWRSRADGAPRTVLLTGGPGSGRTRLLDGFLMLCDPEYRKRIDTAVLDPSTVPAGDLPEPLVFDAAGLTAGQLLWAVADELAPSAGRTVEALRLLAEPRVRPAEVVVADTDRAGVLPLPGEPARVAAEVLLPLAESPGVRLLADVPREQARWLADRLPAAELLVVDLDEEPWADPAGLRLQAEHALGGPGDGPDRVARAAGSPLAVRLAARSALAVPGDGVPLPRGVGDALDVHAGRCGTDELTLRRLLAPLALAAPGEPLPLALWAPLASAVAGRDLGPALAGGRLLLMPFVEPVGDDADPAVRIVHPAVAAEVRERFGGAVREVQRRIAAALLAAVPGAEGGEGPGRWERAAPYVRGQLAGHALEGGVLPELLDDPGFLLHTDQVRLRAAVGHLAASGAGLPPLARTWLRLAPLFTRHEAGPVLRAALLEHACHRDGLPAPDLGPGLPWRTLWTRPLPGVTALTAAVAPDGTVVAAAHVPGAEPPLRVHDALTGEPVEAAPEQLAPLPEERREACPVRLGTGGDYVRLWPREGGGPSGLLLSAGPLGGADVTPDGVLLVADAAGLGALRLHLPAPGRARAAATVEPPSGSEGERPA
ncbi:ATP-binding protein [Streptacidiphilus sp. ASG 303]|uniref:ATP-binding protein n=1 Tax=Streptacidiphilus sp. ASG 303 TaxID=2896847 RepID=UPI001E401AAD|nr:ATP-binding protein [Streptacidiphilus sp. ASG 303]MCD0480933.1 ATP-binding protein [Streptacidiphilus sp. ASG 303]